MKNQSNFLDRYHLSRFIGWIRSLVQSRLFRLIVTVCVVFFCGAYLVKNLRDLKAVQASLQLVWLQLLISFVLVTCIVWTGGLAWVLILRGLGQDIQVMDGLRIQNFSNISKYIPGFIWPYASKIYLCKKVGIDQGVGGLAVLLEFYVLIVAGVFVGLFFLPKEILSQVFSLSLNPFPFRVLVGAGMLLSSWGVLIGLRFIPKKLPISFVTKKIYILAAMILLSLNWLGLGIGIWFMSKSIYRFTPANIESFVFSFTVSVIAGILFLPVPNGIGVRESMMVFLLSRQIPPPVAVFLTIMSRLMITFGEVVNFLGVMLVKKWKDSRKR